MAKATPTGSVATLWPCRYAAPPSGEDDLSEATDPVLTHDHNQPISTVWTSIRNSPRLHLNNRRDLSKVQGQLKVRWQIYL